MKKKKAVRKEKCLPDIKTKKRGIFGKKKKKSGRAS
jgi:hypothetical protein